jgi:purine-nucleoside phosphorylase
VARHTDDHLLPLTRDVSDSEVHRAAQAIRGHTGLAPRIGLILGSGLGELADAVEDAASIPFSEVPCFPPPAVEGHRGRVVVGSLEGHDVIALAGRFHLYEGHPAATAALPVRVMHALGVRTLFVSNAAGGIRRSFRAGDLMLIDDHINLTWRNPLTGPVREGELRFPDMSAPYDPALVRMLREAALEVGVPVVEGVYAALSGPSYETPAEIRMLERLGADAVGMSTVPEVIVARALGMRVAGVSCISNVAAGFASAPLSHAEVLEVTARVRARFERLVRAWVRRVE